MCLTPLVLSNVKLVLPGKKDAYPLFQVEQWAKDGPPFMYSPLCEMRCGCGFIGGSRTLVSDSNMVWPATFCHLTSRRGLVCFLSNALRYQPSVEYHTGGGVCGQDVEPVYATPEDFYWNDSLFEYSIRVVVTRDTTLLSKASQPRHSWASAEELNSPREKALNNIAARLRMKIPDSRHTRFSTAYEIIKNWIKEPIEGRDARLFFIGSIMERSSKSSCIRIGRYIASPDESDCPIFVMFQFFNLGDSSTYSSWNGEQWYLWGIDTLHSKAEMDLESHQALENFERHPQFQEAVDQSYWLINMEWLRQPNEGDCPPSLDYDDFRRSSLMASIGP